MSITSEPIMMSVSDIIINYEDDRKGLNNVNGLYFVLKQSYDVFDCASSSGSGQKVQFDLHTVIIVLLFDIYVAPSTI